MLQRFHLVGQISGVGWNQQVGESLPGCCKVVFRAPHPDQHLSSSLFDFMNHDSILSTRSLCEELIRADTEEEVEAVLKDAGYWDDPSVWAVFGANEARTLQ